MKAPMALVAALAAILASAGLAQQAEPSGLGEVLVTANRASVPYAQDNRPVVGLRRRADSAVMQLVIVSDSRDEATRKQEIHTALLAAMDKAAAAGFELVWGNVQLQRVTKANYKDMPLLGAGRNDTGRLDLLVRGKLEGTAEATRNRLFAFVLGLKGSGRATIGSMGTISLTVINPDQYRDAIIKLVAADAAHTAGLFGPNFTFNVTGIDGQVSWSQVSTTEVFLFIPYRYTIFPK
jgi:hypothetical protein